MAEQYTSNNQEPAPLKAALNELLRAGFGSYELQQAEQERKAAADAKDARNLLQESQEDREVIITRLQAGELLDPEVVAYSGERLLEAQAEVQKIQQSSGIRPPETS